MKAMILAAGLGTRLKPLTDQKPKVLLKAGPYTLLEFTIKKLKSSGFTDIIINLHHLASQVIDYLDSHANFGCNITISDETDKLLDTGGALRKAAGFFNDDQPFLIYNADIVGNINLKEVYDFHLNSGNQATLVVRRRDTTRYLLFDETMQLVEWVNTSKGLSKLVRLTQKPPQAFAFSGIHVMNPSLLPLLGNQHVFSIIDSYLELAKNHQIGGYYDRSTLFADAGKHESLIEADRIAAGIAFDNIT